MMENAPPENDGMENDSPGKWLNFLDWKMAKNIIPENDCLGK